MQQDKYIFHLDVFSTCFGRDITHHQALQNCRKFRYGNGSQSSPKRYRRGDKMESGASILRARQRCKARWEKSVSRFISEFVQFCNSWWWVISRPKHVENTSKWNIYLSWCIKLVFFNYLIIEIWNLLKRKIFSCTKSEFSLPVRDSWPTIFSRTCGWK